jgi:DNA-binding NarL/FixJ family response regulator
MTIRVLIAEDHAVVREGFRHLLEVEAGLTVVGEAKDGIEAVALALAIFPDVVVMDIGLAGLNGIEATRRIVAAGCGARVVGLSMHTDERHVLEMLRAGASGYIPKDSGGAELIAAVRAVAAGGSYISPALMAPLVAGCIVHPAPTSEGAWGRLSDREREVLQLLAEGSSVKEIADRLALSGNTVHSHRRNLMAKLGLRSVAQLTRFAIREGLTEL